MEGRNDDGWKDARMEGKGWKGRMEGRLPAFAFVPSSLPAFVVPTFLPSCPEFLPSCPSALLPSCLALDRLPSGGRRRCRAFVLEPADDAAGAGADDIDPAVAVDVGGDAAVHRRLRFDAAVF